MTVNVNWREILSLFNNLIEKEIDRWEDTHQEENIEDLVQQLVRITGATEQEVRDELPLPESH